MAVSGDNVPSRADPEQHGSIAAHRDLLAVFGFALVLRLLFLLLTHDTYDYDEFVSLLLGRDYAAGAVPYRDFVYFHPPGILVVLRGINPLTHLWWPSARALTALVDTGSAVMVWKIGGLLWGRREALAAGILYALSPLALVSATRVGQEPLITALGLLGLVVLLSQPSWQGAVIAGACLAIAVWVKYPAAYFLPVYVLAAPKRAILVATSAAAVLTALFLPFYANANLLYQQTIHFQQVRWLMGAGQRVETTGLFWLLVNPLALPAVIWRPRPLWLAAGFALGGVFVFSSQVYYHYFTIVVPFAALLSAPLVIAVGRIPLRLLALGGVAVACAWATVLDIGGSSPLYVTAAHLSSVAPTVRLLEAPAFSAGPVLGDRYEYAYLAGRPALAHYFWNIGVLVDARYLEKRLPARGAVVLSYGASSGYPAGFVQYLNARFRRVQTPDNWVWLLSANHSHSP